MTYPTTNPPTVPLPSGPNTDLPMIADWKAKSVWLAVIIPGALVIANLLGFNLLEAFGVTTAEALADKVYTVFILILSIAGVVARAAPQARLKFFGQIAGAPAVGPEVRSPAVVGALAVGMAFLLAACADWQGITVEQQQCVAREAVEIVTRGPAYEGLDPYGRATAAATACGMDAQSAAAIDLVNTAIVAAQKAL